MTRPFQDLRTASARTCHHSFESWTFAHDRFLHDEAVDFQVRVVLRVGDRALERFVDQERRLFGRKSENVQRRRNRQALDLSRDFAHLKCGNPRILIYRSNFHYFKLTLEASTWSRSPT